MERFEEKKNFNIASTAINENIRISTAALFYDEWFGERFQMETWIFVKEDDGKLKSGASKMKIHNVLENQNGIDYCLRFHHLACVIVKLKLLTPELLNPSNK